MTMTCKCNTLLVEKETLEEQYVDIATNHTLIRHLFEYKYCSDVLRGMSTSFLTYV